jgi:BNR repeat-like domain
MELSFRDVLRNLYRRFRGDPGSTDAAWPYRRIRPSTKVLHQPVLINLQTSDGSGQACHPDVLHVPSGFGAGQWPYWMVCTPYPFGDSSLENPELFVSFDGISWAPASRKGSIVATPQPQGSHNSDPDLVFHENRLWLFYRETIRGARKGTPDKQTIYCMKSDDGEVWSHPSRVLSDSTGAQLLSPAVIHNGESFVMWTVEMRSGTLQICRRDSDNGEDWRGAETTSLAGLPADRQPWHIDVLQEKDRLSAILVSCTAAGGVGSRIHYAYSEDNGFTWLADSFLLSQGYQFESKLQYRGSLCKSHTHPEIYGFWYSAASHSDVFSIAYLELIRKNETLVSRPLVSKDAVLAVVD